MAKSELPNIIVQGGSSCNNSGSRDGEIENYSSRVSYHTDLEEEMQEACTVSPPVAIHIEDRDSAENGDDNEETSDLIYDYAVNHSYESHTVKQQFKVACAEEKETKGEKSRARSSRVKLLVRSQAIHDDTSPPPEFDAVTANNNMLSVVNFPVNAQNQSRTSSRHDHLGKQSSSQSSNDGSTSSLSRDSSTETYTDSTGIDLQQFIIETLNKNQKDKMMLMKLEHDFTMLIKDSSRQTFKFPQMSSYNRMLVHRVAAFFGLEHNVDHNGTAIIVNKSRNTRIPDFKFSDQVRDDLSHEEPKKMILKRDNSSFEDGTEKMTEKQYLDSRRSKSFEEREEEYQKAKARIFNKEDPSSIHSESIMILSHSQDILHSDCQSLQNGDDALKYSAIQYSSQHTDELSCDFVEGKPFEKLIHTSQSKDLNNEYRPPMMKSNSFGGISVLISENSSTKGNNTITKADSLNATLSGNLSSAVNIHTTGNIVSTSSSPTVSLSSESVVTPLGSGTCDKTPDLSDIGSTPLTLMPPASQQFSSQACSWINVEDHRLPIAAANSTCPKNGILPTSSVAEPSTDQPNAKDEITNKKPLPNGPTQSALQAHFQPNVAAQLQVIAPNEVHSTVPAGQLYQQQFIPAVVYIPCISAPNQPLLVHPSLSQQQGLEQRQNCLDSTPSNVEEVTNQIAALNIDSVQSSALSNVNSHTEDTGTVAQASSPLLKMQNTMGHSVDPTCYVQHNPGLFPIPCFTTTASLFHGNNSMAMSGSDVSHTNEDDVNQTATQSEKCSATLPNGNMMIAPQTGNTLNRSFYNYASGFPPSVITSSSNLYHYPAIAVPNINPSNSSQPQQNSLLVTPAPLPQAVSTNSAGLPAYMSAGTSFPHHGTNVSNTPYNAFRPQTPPMQNVTAQPHPSVAPYGLNYSLYQPLQNQHTNTFKCPNTSNQNFSRSFPVIRPNIPLVGNISNNSTIAPPRFPASVLTNRNQASFAGNKPGDLLRVKNGSINSSHNSQKAANNQLQLGTQFVAPKPNFGPMFYRGYPPALQDIPFIGHPLQQGYSNIVMSQPHHTNTKHNHSRHSKSRKHRDKGTNAGNRPGFSNNNMQEPKTSNNTLQVEGFPDGMKKNEMERYLDLVTGFGGKIHFVSLDGRLCDGNDFVVGSKHQVLAVFETSTIAQSALLNIKTNKFQLRPLRRKDRNSSKNIQ